MSLTSERRYCLVLFKDTHKQTRSTLLKCVLVTSLLFLVHIPSLISLSLLQEMNTEKLTAFINTLNGKEGAGSHLVTVPPGPSLADALLSSPILAGEGGAVLGLGASDFEFGVDPSADPELALVRDTQLVLPFLSFQHILWFQLYSYYVCLSFRFNFPSHFTTDEIRLNS